MLLEASGVAVLLLVLVAGLVGYLIGTQSPERERRAVAVEVRPPGLRRLPPGQVKRMRIIRVVTLTPAVATRYGVAYREGVLVTEVAADEGELPPLRRLDVVVAVNGRTVKTEADLAAHLHRYRSAGWVEVVVVRSGALMPVRVPVEAFDG